MGPSDGEMGGFWMSKLVEQLQLCLAVFGAKIKPGKARSSGPHIDDILDILEKEGFLTLTPFVFVLVKILTFVFLANFEIF